MQLRNGKVINEKYDGIVGYKMGMGKRLIKLIIPPTAQHNVERPGVVNKQFAKHRCSEAFVKEIMDLKTGELLNEASSMFTHSTFKYIVGQKVFPKSFDEDLDNVHGGGIHFFLDRRRAEMYDSPRGV